MNQTMENLLILLVTAEQENLIQSFYQQHSWKMLNIGPHIPDLMKSKIFQIFSSTLKQRKNVPCTGKKGGESSFNMDENKTEPADSKQQNSEKEQKLPGQKPKKLKTEIRSSKRINKVKPDKVKNKDEEARDKIKSKVEVGLELKPKKQNRNKTNGKDCGAVKSNNKTTKCGEQSKLNGEGEMKEDADISKESTSPSNVEINEVDKESCGQVRFQCSKCSYTTNYHSNYLRHTREVHVLDRHPCTRCRKTFKSKHEAKSHLVLAHIKCLQCDKCSKKFTSRGGLLNHTKQVHQKKVLYKCEICDATFFYRQHYIGHMNRHSANKPYSCNKCSKTFVYKSSCNIHEKTCQTPKEDTVKIVEKTKNKVLCDICGEELSSKAVLKMHHRLVHSDEPKSKCSQCDKSFKGVYSLRRHVNIAHTDAKNSSFPCEVCGKSFNQIQVLRQHVKRHKKEFSVYCPTCGKGFYSNFKLKEHERTHTGEKPFSCPLCPNFKCASKYNLASHLKVHGVEKRTKGRRGKTVAAAKTSSDRIPTGDYSPKQGQGHFTKISVNEDQGQCSENEGAQVEGHLSGMSVREEASGRLNGDPAVYRYLNQTNGHLISGSHGTDQGQGQSDLSHNSIMGINVPTSIHYGHEQGQYQPSMGLHCNNGIGYESRVHGDGYYSNTSSAVAQGLNILTVAMNLLDHNPY